MHREPSQGRARARHRAAGLAGGGSGSSTESCTSRSRYLISGWRSYLNAPALTTCVTPACNNGRQESATSATGDGSSWSVAGAAHREVEASHVAE